MATSSRKDRYDAYIASDAWRENRKPALEYAEHRCQVCNADKHLDVHHRTYERLGNEKPGDLTVLCRSCHEIFHDSGRRLAKPKAETREIYGQNVTIKWMPGKRRKVKSHEDRLKRLRDVRLKPCTKCGRNKTTKGICKPCKKLSPIGTRKTTRKYDFS